MEGCMKTLVTGYSCSCLLLLLQLLSVKGALRQQGEHRQPQRTVTLQILVMDKDSRKPIKDADVWVKSEEQNEDFDETVTTSKEGSVRLSGVPQGPLRIQVTARGWQP